MRYLRTRHLRTRGVRNQFADTGKMSKQPKSEKYVNSDDDDSINKPEKQANLKRNEAPSPQKECKQLKAERRTKKAT